MAYSKLSKIQVNDPAVQSEYATTAEMILDQSTQKQGYFYKANDSYYEYLGTTVGDITDYKSVGSSSDNEVMTVTVMPADLSGDGELIEQICEYINANVAIDYSKNYSKLNIILGDGPAGALGLFDVTADWSLTSPPVTDEASFREFLENGNDGDGNGNNFIYVFIQDFTITDIGEKQQITCSIYAEDSDMCLANIGVSEFGGLGIENVYSLYLYSNELTYFTPTVLPAGLEQLDLSSNNITEFNPGEGVLPDGLEYLYLNGNSLTVFDPDYVLPSNLYELHLDNNQLTTFNPSISLPESVYYLYMRENLIDLTGYTTMETWADSLDNVPFRGVIYLDDNVYNYTGGMLAGKLYNKGWQVEGLVDLHLCKDVVGVGITTVGLRYETVENGKNTYRYLPTAFDPNQKIFWSGTDWIINDNTTPNAFNSTEDVLTPDLVTTWTVNNPELFNGVTVQLESCI